MLFLVLVYGFLDTLNTIFKIIHILNFSKVLKRNNIEKKIVVIVVVLVDCV